MAIVPGIHGELCTSLGTATASLGLSEFAVQPTQTASLEFLPQELELGGNGKTLYLQSLSCWLAKLAYVWKSGLFLRGNPTFIGFFKYEVRYLERHLTRYEGRGFLEPFLMVLCRKNEYGLVTARLLGGGPAMQFTELGSRYGTRPPPRR